MQMLSLARKFLSYLKACFNVISLRNLGPLPKQALRVAALIGALSSLVGACTGGPSKPKHIKPRGLLFTTNSGLTWPSEGRVISPYGPRNGRMHSGIDIKGSSRSAIYAVDQGKVIFAGYLSGYGLSLIIKHKKHFSLYGHCSKLKVRKHQHVRKGQTIAVTGSTGNASTEHLHFEYQNEHKEALDPMDYLQRPEESW